MLSKIVAQFGFMGVVALAFGALYYNINNVWDWKAQAGVYGGLALIAIYVVTNLSRIRAAMGTRTVRYGGAAGTSLVLVLGILILLNFLNFRHHKRVDLTETQLYGLSEQSRKVVRGLEQQIRVIGFFQPSGGARNFEELLKEYRYVSNRVSYELVDPQQDPARTAEYEIRRNGQIVVEYGPRREIIDELSEERITNAIIKVTREGERVVYFLQGHGEKDLNETGAEGYSLVREALERQDYRVQTYNLAQEDSLPEDATVIVSAGPEFDFLPHEVELLKQHLEEGGKLMILADPQNDFRMTEFLAEYGLGVGENVVIDASGVGRLFNLGPAVPLVTEYSDHPVTREMGMRMTFFPFAQSVELTDSPLGYQTEPLFSSSPRSWGETELEGDEITFDEGKDVLGPLPMAAVATRVVSNGPPLEGTNGGDEGEEAPDPETGESRLVLFGDSDFAANAYFRQAGNADLFLNTVSWLAEDADLIAIRPRDPEDRRVNLTAGQSRIIFWGAVVFLPLATLIVGVSVWRRRR